MATTPIGEKLLTADEFLRLCEQGLVKGELINGVIQETVSANGEHGEIASAVIFAFGSHVRPNRLGRVTGTDAGVLLERNPDTVREPDVAYFSAETLPLDVKIRGFYEVVPDLVVEVVSPNDRPREIADKVAMWLSHGVRLVWAVYPAARTVVVHTSEGPVLTYTENDELDGGEVLPNFRCPVRDILDW